MTQDKRGLKNRKNLSNAIEKELWHALDDLAKETEISKSKLLDKAVRHLIIDIYKRTDLIEKNKKK
jgi:hypothetical protein